MSAKRVESEETASVAGAPVHAAPPYAPAKIALKSVRKIFETEDGGQLEVLRGISANILDKEFVVLIGLSGGGKTTLLNIIAGLLEPTDGQVLMDGRKVTGPGRERGMVFQQDAILMWRKVLGNIEYGLETRGVPKAERCRIALEHMALVGLDPKFASFFPKELSGGMKKRVQIAAVFANDPEVLLLDEPFGSLDYPTKVALQQQLLHIWEREKKTAIFVTHDVEEALFLADRVFVLRNGLFETIVDVPFQRPRPADLRGRPEFREMFDRLWQELGGATAARG